MLRNPIHLLRGHLSRMFVFLKAQPKECISNGGISGLREGRAGLSPSVGGQVGRKTCSDTTFYGLLETGGLGLWKGGGRRQPGVRITATARPCARGGPGSMRRVKRRALCGAGASASLGSHPAPVQARFTSLPGVGCTPAPLACPALRSALVFRWEEPIERREPWA